MISDEELPPDIIRATIWTRPDDAADAFAAGLADNLISIEPWKAAGILAGAGMDGVFPNDVARQLVLYAAVWMEAGGLSCYRVRSDSQDMAWTSLRPKVDWEPVDPEEEWDVLRGWMVAGAGLATTKVAAAALAMHAWVHRVDSGLLDAMPTVTLAGDEARYEGFQGATVARDRGIPIGAIDRAYGVLRAAGLEVSSSTLLAAAAGITWADQGPTEDDAPDGRVDEAHEVDEADEVDPLAVEIMAASLSLSRIVAKLVAVAQGRVGDVRLLALQREPSVWDRLPEESRFQAMARIVRDPDLDFTEFIAQATGVDQ